MIPGINESDPMIPGINESDPMIRPGINESDPMIRHDSLRYFYKRSKI
jgi:hypothetical protein